MRVSLLTFDFGESVVPLATGLAEQADVQLLVPDGELEPFRALLDSRVVVDAFAKPRLRQPLRQLRMVHGLRRAIASFAPDVVHVQQGHLWWNLFLWSVRRPVVVTVHDPHPHLGDRGGRRTPQRVMDVAFRRADVVIAHAEYVKAALVRRGLASVDAVRVIPLAFPAAGPTRPPVGAGGAGDVLCFGRVWPYKGLEHLIRAAPLLSPRVPNATFVVAGEGEPLDRYRAMVRDPARFRFEEGFVSLERREELFASASVIVLPYVEATQTGVIPLAYRHGKPVVATTVGGLPELVIDGETGLLVPPADDQALADALAALLLDDARRRRCGAAARRFFEVGFDLRTIVEKTMSAYELAVCTSVRRRRGGQRALPDAPRRVVPSSSAQPPAGGKSSKPS